MLQDVGIDYDERKKEYTLTVEVFDVSQSAGADEVSGGNFTKVITVNGANVSFPARELRELLKCGKYVCDTTAKTVEKCLDDLNCDAFGFGKRMWILYPSYFENKVNPKRKRLPPNRWISEWMSG